MFVKQGLTKTSYGRLYQRAKKYRGMLAAGIFCGMLVGGAWLPIFRMIQPVLLSIQAGDGADTRVIVRDRMASDGVTLPPSLSVPHSELQRDNSPKEKIIKKVRRLDRYTSQFGVRLVDDQGEVRDLLFLFGFLILPVALALKLLAQYLNEYLLQWVGKRVTMDLRNDLFCHLQNQSLKFHGMMNVGDLMSRCGNDPMYVERLLTRTVAQACRAPFEVLAALGFVVWFAVTNGMLEMILIVSAGYPLCLWLLLKMRRAIGRYIGNLLEFTANLSSVMLENLTCIRVIKAYHTEAAEKEKQQRFSAKVANAQIKGAVLGTLIDPLVEFVNVSLCLLFMVYCYWRGKSPADIMPLVIPLIVAYKPIKTLGNVYMAIVGGGYALGRIFSLLDTHMTLLEAVNPVVKKSFDREIEFRMVAFHYQKKERQILSDINFKLEKGRMVAVVGATGSGKTTIANLLARFYDVTGGTVLIDGIDVRSIAIKDLRTLVGVVNQETILFNRTIAENIAYGRPEASQGEVEAAAKLANAHDFIVQHQDGYGRIVGDKGFVLSGGERQRIAIARVILKNPPILILDEATSALDTVTEKLVQDALERLMKTRTVFVIAHRLSTVRNADAILVMEQGVIVEQGTHGELYAKGGAYRRLCDVQKQLK